MSRSAERRCGLCGHAFDVGALSCHDRCPIAPRCRVICCPNCGYEVPDEEASALGRLFTRIRAPRARRPAPEQPVGGVSMATLADGEVAEISSLDAMPGQRSARLSALGLVPGVSVTLRRRRPSPILVVGQTEIAVSDEILAQISVAPPEAPGPPAQATTVNSREASFKRSAPPPVTTS